MVDTIFTFTLCHTWECQGLEGSFICSWCPGFYSMEWGEEGLHSWDPRDCGNQGDSPWQVVSTPRALQRAHSVQSFYEEGLFIRVGVLARGSGLRFWHTFRSLQSCSQQTEAVDIIVEHPLPCSISPGWPRKEPVRSRGALVSMTASQACERLCQHHLWPQYISARLNFFPHTRK